jgi:hypothetical protein
METIRGDRLYRKAAKSGANGSNCVLVSRWTADGHATPDVRVEDSKRPEGEVVLSFAPAAFDLFLAEVRGGRFTA